MRHGWLAGCCALMLLASVGCNSPYYADKGALVGGLGGAGVGALVGNAVGNTAAGAVIGAGVGAIGGAAIGSGMDDIEARNRAQIAAQMGRQIPAGAVTVNDVITMTHAGVNEELIVNHIHANGPAQVLQTGDLIMLQQQGVSPRVIAALQAPPAVAAAPQPVYVAQPTPVIVEERWDPYYYHPHYYHHYYRRPSIGFTVSN